MDALGILLRFVHVWAAIAWAGAGFFLLAVLDPMMARIGVADSNRFMRHIQLRTKLAAYFPVIAVLTVGAGIGLYAYLRGKDAIFNVSTTQGLVFHVGAAAGVLAFLWGFSMEGRLNGKIGKVARRIEAAGAPDPALERELTTLSAQLRSATRVSGFLLLVSVFGMGTFRYF